MNERPLYYRLDANRIARPCSSLIEWAEYYELADRHVADERIGDARISTVFLGIDHSFGFGGLPLIFETMIFGGTQDGYCDRCSTWQEAEAMHARACNLVRETMSA